MKRAFFPAVIFLFIVGLPWIASRATSDPAPRLIQVSDTINPGTADFIGSAIHSAEAEHAPYLVIELDTPGGLLTSTRQIVRDMLNSSVPIVVYVGPRGARAGSAGALITFAADVAVMAPSTNIGAAHPVSGYAREMSKTMNEKITNDTAAFAESLAKAHHRNPDRAIKAVREAESLPVDKAVAEGVVDLVADDLTDLRAKLSGYTLKVPKHGISRLPDNVPSFQSQTMSVKQRAVSFISDPNLSYLILALGGLCIWVELSHPGLVLPGVVGVICFLVSMISFQALPIDYGALVLTLVGMGLLFSELFFPTYGALGIGGIVCFILGSLFLMDTSVPEFRISTFVIFPTAAVFAAFAVILGLLVMKSRRLRVRSGLEAMIGELGEAREDITEKAGKVIVHGELWSAVSNDKASIPSGSIVVVREVRDMRLLVSLKT